MTTDVTIRPRAIRLLEYLEAVRSLREHPVRDVAEYQDRRWWAGDIPAHPSCVLTATGAEPWLTVSKAQVPSAPAVPAGIEAHLRTGVTDPEVEPVFPAAFDDWYRDDPGEAGRLRAILRGYVEGPWRAWAPQARLALSARKLYEDLYELRLRLQREAALTELVWGHGILSWATGGTRIVHPMVTTQVELSFDPDTGALSIEPEALVPHLEIDLLQGLDLKGFDVLVDLRERFRADPIGPFDERCRILYEQLLAPLGLDGRIVDSNRPVSVTPAAAITASWVLMVRRRSTLYRRFFAGLRDALVSQQTQVAAPLAAVVADEPSRLNGEDSQGDDGSWRQVAERLLMPLPTNPEQEDVARRLAEHRGVTVQGPPGTGKTHTIANLISHLVGHGKRVLVTSQKEQALTVLRAKIPESIRDLSVAVLGSSAASITQLDQSVQAIYEHAVTLDRPSARARIAELDSRLNELQRDVGALRNRISASIARERKIYPIGTATYTPSTLGQWLADNARELGYIPDTIGPTASCPLSDAEIADLYRFARVLDPADRAQARLRLPAPEQLPSHTELASAAARLSEVRDGLASTEALVGDRVALEGLGPEGLSALIAAVEQAASDLARLEQPWLAVVRAELRTPAFAATWRDQIKALQEGIEELAAWQGSLLGHTVVLPDDGLPPKELIEQLERLRERLASGKGVSKTFQKELYRVREACSVDEEPPRGVADVELCIIEARSRRRRYEIIRRWNGVAERIGGPQLDPGASHPEYTLEQHMRGLRNALAWEDGIWDGLRDWLRASGVRVPEQAASASLASIADALKTAALYVTERDLTARLGSVRKYLADGASYSQASSLWRALLEAFDSASWNRWGQTVEEVRRICALTHHVARFDNLTRQLAEAAPRWAARIVDSRGDENAGPPGTALRAWEWRRADTWLSEITSADDPAALQRQLEASLRAVADVTTRLASESAWLSVAERLTDAERRALTAWVQALRKVGKGTGKYAAHWRAIAQQEMKKAESAVPVWIMPTYRVVESFDPATTMFDVVIVDESSQCDLFGLAALGIACKAVVVGDDKQISPQAIGTEESAVHDLITQHIPDLPQAELLDIKTSLYDLSKMRFPGVIMLKEHFRCLPEIIEFSNRLAYDGKILPLREQPADQSWQSVIDIHIPDGYREPGTDTNLQEAEYIAGKITELCADQRYDGKTFGVISLLGDGQAELIERKLIALLGEKEMERRKIRCGNAYHFQGDERHVMFLSVVIAAGEGRRIGAMTKESDRQRINVAASRAQDQMWCIRSISPDELHPDDVRGRFIRYCQNPARVDDATSQAEDRFDSEFERDVYRHLIARGYRVRVQHRVGRFRIDLVVEGRRGRLAVELDGDAYHGPDRWEADRSRQAILERLGWTFHRIRGSAYYRNPDGALAGLWDRLEALGIRPADAPDPSPPPVVTVNSAQVASSTGRDPVTATSPRPNEPTVLDRAASGDDGEQAARTAARIPGLRADPPIDWPEPLTGEAIPPASGTAQAYEVGTIKHVPRTEAEQKQLLLERPYCWEYLYFGARLLHERNAVENKYRNHLTGYALPTGDGFNREGVTDYVQRVMGDAEKLIHDLERFMSNDAQEQAFGPRGVEGDSQAIAHLAKRFNDIYEGLMDWAAKVRGVSRPSEFDRYIELLASINDSPISTYRNFVDDYVAANDRLPAQIIAGEPVYAEWKLKITIPAETTNALEAEFARLFMDPAEAREPRKELTQSMALLTQALQDLSEILVEYHRCLINATPQMTAATTFDETLTVINRLADDLTPIADRYSDRVQASQNYLHVVDRSTRALFRIYRDSSSSWEDQSIRELMKNIRALARVALASIDSIQEFYNSLDRSKGISPKLDEPVQRMQSSILIMTGNRGIFTDWLEQSKDLGFND